MRRTMIRIVFSIPCSRPTRVRYGLCRSILLGDDAKFPFLSVYNADPLIRLLHLLKHTQQQLSQSGQHHPRGCDYHPQNSEDLLPSLLRP